VIVLDSSFLIGFHNQRDVHHAAGRDLMTRFLEGEWGRGLLPEYVFLEVVTVLLFRRDLAVATHVGRLLVGAEELDFVRCGEFFAEAFGRFCGQQNTRLSLADVSIALIAQQRAEGLRVDIRSRTASDMSSTYLKTATACFVP
jgi:predicted nucleic acid-binding protein